VCVVVCVRVRVRVCVHGPTLPELSTGDIHMYIHIYINTYIHGQDRRFRNRELAILKTLHHPVCC